jgi:acyl phosphate:glycerol-3-phosphate acyltransferase
MIALWILAAAVLGYVLGSVSFAVLIARSRGVDILKEGSGNPGATNVKRVLGAKAGNTVFVLDFLKGLVAAGWPMLAVGLNLLAADAAVVSWMGIAGLAGAIVGHSCSMFLRFRGGKGVATTIGGLMALMPLVMLGGIVVWLAVFYMFRYVSLASLVMGVVLVPLAWGFQRPGEQIGLCAVLAVVIFVRHLPNIKRLLDGTEHKFEKKGKSGTTENTEDTAKKK